MSERKSQGHPKRFRNKSFGEVAVLGTKIGLGISATGTAGLVAKEAYQAYQSWSEAGQIACLVGLGIVSVPVIALWANKKIKQMKTTQAERKWLQEKHQQSIKQRDAPQTEIHEPPLKATLRLED